MVEIRFRWHIFGAVSQGDLPIIQKFVSWLFGFYSISTFVDYLMPNPFLYKIVPFQTIQYSIGTQFNCQKDFHFKLFSLVKQF